MRGESSINSESLYSQETLRYPSLSEEEQRELAIAIEQGKAAEEELVKAAENGGISEPRQQQLDEAAKAGKSAWLDTFHSNTRLVMKVAAGYNWPGHSFMDLVQEGNFGLMDAIDTFDWRMGNRFSTHATWRIRSCIARIGRIQHRMIDTPYHIGDELRGAQNFAAEDDIFRQRCLSPRLLEISRLVYTPTFDELNNIDDSEREIDNLLPDNQPTPEEIAISNIEGNDDDSHDESRDRLRDLLELIPARGNQNARTMIEAKYGINDGIMRTDEEVAEMFRLKPESVRRATYRAIDSIKRELEDRQAEQTGIDDETRGQLLVSLEKIAETSTKLRRLAAYKLGLADGTTHSYAEVAEHFGIGVPGARRGVSAALRLMELDEPAVA